MSLGLGNPVDLEFLFLSTQQAAPLGDCNMGVVVNPRNIIYQLPPISGQKNKPGALSFFLLGSNIKPLKLV